jgi:predicted nucleic-acid-binding Zn-ribbon protein
MMRWLINYFRQCFCKHEFDREEIATYASNFDRRPHKIVVHMTCNKCGYHTKYKK